MHSRERRVRSSVALSQVEDTAHEGIHWAEIGVTATAEADDFAANPFFWSVKVRLTKVAVRS